MTNFVDKVCETLMPSGRQCSRVARVEMVYRGFETLRWSDGDRRCVCRQHSHQWEFVGWRRIGWIVRMVENYRDCVYPPKRVALSTRQSKGRA